MIALDLLEGEDLVDAVSTEVMGWERGMNGTAPVWWHEDIEGANYTDYFSWNPTERHDDKLAILHQIFELGATEEFIRQWGELTNQQFGVIELMMCDPESICLAAVATVREMKKGESK